MIPLLKSLLIHSEVQFEVCAGQFLGVMFNSSETVRLETRMILDNLEISLLYACLILGLILMFILGY